MQIGIYMDSSMIVEHLTVSSLCPFHAQIEKFFTHLKLLKNVHVPVYE